MKKKSLCRNTLKIILAVSLLTLPVHMTAAADFSDGFQNSETENENFSDSHESSEYANSEDVTEETTEENELSLEDTTDTDDIPLENFSENSYDELNNSFNAGNEISAGNSSSYSDKNITCNLNEDGTTITITGNDVYLRHDIVNPLINSGLNLSHVKNIIIGNGARLSSGWLSPFHDTVIDTVTIQNAQVNGSFSDAYDRYNCTIKNFIVEKGTVSGWFENVESLIIKEGVTCISDIHGKKLKYVEINATSDTQIMSDTFSYSHLENAVISGPIVLSHGMFSNLETLKSVTLKNGITGIGEFAFNNCTNLSSVNFDNTVLTTIDSWAFQNCTALSNIDFPDTLTRIGSVAFSNTKLTKAILPESLTELDSNAFSNCSELSEINIPSQLNIIGDGAFSNCISLKEVDIPPTVKTIGFGAFRRTGVNKVTLHEGLTTIKCDAFMDCLYLNEIEIPTTVTKIDWRTFGMYMGDDKIHHMVPGGFRLKGLINSEAERYVWYDPVFGLEESNIEFVSLGGDISNCIVKGISSKTTYTNDPTFTVCSNHELVTLVKDRDYTVTYTNKGQTRTVTVKGIGKYTGTLTRSYSMKTASKTSLSKAAISGITNKTYTGKAITLPVKVTIGKTVLSNNKDYTLTWKNNKNIGTATVTITGKGNYTGTVKKSFSITVKKNSSYTVGTQKYKITNPNTNGTGTITLLGITNKTNISSVTIPSTVKIGGKSFRITAIGTNAFNRAKKLKTLRIGRNITTIGSKAFYQCSSLANVTVDSIKLQASKTGSNAFKGIRTNCTFKVPASKVSTYKKLLQARGASSKIKVLRK